MGGSLRPAVAILSLCLLGFVATSGGHLHAQQPGPAHVAVALVIDNSGSNADTDPQDLRYAAARQFVDLLEPGDELAAVVFSQQVQLALPLQRIESDADRTRVREALANRRYESDTNMLPAFAEARSQLRKSANSRRVLIFLTDGELAPASCDTTCRQAQRSQLVADSGGANSSDGIHVYTVALGTALDANLLQEMASGGGGIYQQADRADRIAPAFQRIFEREGLTVFEALFADALAPGQSREITFSVHRFVTTLALFVTLPLNGTITSTLSRPDGREIGPTTAEAAYIGYRVQGPQNGRWVLKLTNAGSTPATVGVTSNLRADVSAAWREPSAEVRGGVPVALELEVLGRLPGQAEPRPIAQIYSDVVVEVVARKGSTERRTVLQAQGNSLRGQMDALEPGDWELLAVARSQTDGKLIETATRVKVVDLPPGLAIACSSPREGLIDGDEVELSCKVTSSPSALGADAKTRVSARYFARDEGGAVKAEVPLRYRDGDTWTGTLKLGSGKYAGQGEARLAGTTPDPAVDSAKSFVVAARPQLRVALGGTKAQYDRGKSVPLTATVTAEPRFISAGDAEGVRVVLIVRQEGAEPEEIEAKRQDDGSYRADWKPGKVGAYEIVARASSERALEGVSAPAAAAVRVPPRNWTPIILSVLLVLLVIAAALFAYDRMMVPRFSERAVLVLAGNPVSMRRKAGFTFMRAQRFRLGGPGSDLDVGVEDDVAVLTAAGGTRAKVRAVNGTQVYVSGEPLERPRTISFGAGVSGDGWSVDYNDRDDAPGY